MSVDRFRFVSPGVFINEIDQSQVAGRRRGGAGPVVFGVAEKGPALVPVTVSTYADFVNMFGRPMPGTGRNSDVWRNGNHANPTYGAYAAKAYLANSAPLTFVRLVGDQDPAANADGLAGWDFPLLTPSSKGGPYGLFIVGSGSTRHGEGMLAAVFYLTGSDATIELSGNLAGTVTPVAGAGTLIEPVSIAATSTAEYKVRISSSLGIKEKTFNFDPKSGRYIRSVFNTNPQLLNSAITIGSNLEDHLLGPSYERSVLDFVQPLDGDGDISRTDFSDTYGVILGLVSGSANGANFRTGYVTPATPWIVAQQLGTDFAKFDINSTVPRLFRVHSREGVEYAQSHYKISFSDIKPSTNPQFEAYGTFTLLVRDLQDTDENPVIYEQFNNLSLNPASNNYIGRKIGDKSFEYDSVNLKWRELGQYPNRSKYIRVEMDEEVDNGSQEASLLPFGYRGIPTYRGFNGASGSLELLDFSLTTDPASLAKSIFRDGGSGSLPGGPGTGRGASQLATSQILFSGSIKNMVTPGNVLQAGLALTNSAGLVEIFVPSTSSYRMASGSTLQRPAGAGRGGPGQGSYVFWTTGSSPFATALTTATNLKNVLDNSALSKLGLTSKVVTAGAVAILQLTQSAPGTAGNATVGITGSSIFDSAPFWAPNILSASAKGFSGGLGSAGDTSAIYWGARVGSGGLIDAASFLMPQMAMRASSADGNLARSKNAFFGLTTNQGPDTLIFDGTIRDLIRVMPQGLAARTVILSPGFSLDDIVISAGPTARHSGSELGVYNNTIVGNTDDIKSSNPYRGTPQGARRAGTSKTALSSSYASLLNAGWNRFTVPMYGGFDGVDIQERNPFNNSRALAGTDKLTRDAPMYYTIKKAIDSVADQDQININLAAIPGVTDTQTTDYLLAMAEERKDVLAIIDLENGFIPSTENTDSFSARKGTSADTVSGVEDRDFNSSYGCAYYPWVQIQDTSRGRRLWVPPSTIALGVLASSAAKTALWFAPAGFNRGGLGGGSAGLRVTNVIERLTSEQRDNLYEVNVNPIASFPSEGIVVFGQKTLQATPSALDRINVRRLLIYLKKQIRIIANNILFDPNVQVTWNRFTNRVDPFLSSVKQRYGLSDYRVILDKSTTTPDLVDRNIMYAKILLKPTRAIEFIALDFVITRSGVEF